MAAAVKPPQGAARKRADGRKQLLVYLDPEVIKNLKKTAVDMETTASALTERALLQWLAGSNGSKRGTKK